MTGVNAIERSTEKTREWLRQLADELGGEDEQMAYRVLRAFLHTLRDRLPVEESAQFAAQMPIVIRGIYYESWRPASTPQTYRDLDEFLNRVAKEAQLAGETEASLASAAAVSVLRRHISPGELEDIAATLPRELKRLLNPEAEDAGR